jgi:hypothetical protein
MHFTQGTRVAKMLAYFPLQGLLRGLLYKTAVSDSVSLYWRSLAARAWRALWASYKPDIASR